VAGDAGNIPAIQVDYRKRLEYIYIYNSFL